MKYGVMVLLVAALMVFGFVQVEKPRAMDSAGDNVASLSNEKASGDFTSDSTVPLDGGALCCYDSSGKLQGNCPESLPWYKDTGLCYATERQCESTAETGSGSCYSCGACK